MQSQNPNLFKLNGNGSICSLKKGEKEFLLADSGLDLFMLRFRNATGKTVFAPSNKAAAVVQDQKTDDTGVLHTIEFKDIPVSPFFPQTVSATVTVRCPKDSEMTYWRISVDFEASPLLEYLEFVEFPGLVLEDDLVGVDGNSQLFWPLNEGCLVEDVNERGNHGFGYRPMEYPTGGWVGLYPGPVQMQFMALTNPEGSLYMAAHDPEGHPKEIEYCPAENGIRIFLKVFTGAATGPWSMPYDMVIGTFEGDWQDAADIYRDWSDANLASKPERLQERTDLPEWLDESPVVVTYGVTGPGHHAGPTKPNELFPFANVIPYLNKYGEAFGTKMLNVPMQWEGTAPWSPPYGWPPLGGEEAFKEYADELHDNGHILGLYCSGTSWTQFSSTGPGNYDRREDFVKDNMAKEMTKGPQGEMIARVCNGDALRHGYDFCPDSDRCLEILSDEAKKMRDAGVDYIQLFDQNLGAAPYFCYSPEHGHPQGPGLWETKAMRGLINGIQDSLDKEGRKVILGCESAAAETFLDNLPLNDLRFPMTFPFGRPVPAFAHVYHEYVNNFQGNQVSTSDWIDTDSSPHHVLLLTAYSFAVGDLMTIIFKDGGKIHWSWCCKWDVGPPEQEPIIELIHNLTAWRKGAGKEYLRFGRMQKALDLDGVKDYSFKRKKGSSLSYPSVLTTRWSLSERPEAQFLVNYLPEEQTVTVATEPGTAVTVYNTSDGENLQKIETTGPMEVTIRPLDAVMLTFS